MAKPLGEKSRIIREAIAAHPRLGNAKLAKAINDSVAGSEDGIEVTPQDVAKQKQAMKKLKQSPASGKAKMKPGPKPKALASAASAPASGNARGGPVDVIDRVITLAQQCGGVAELKRLVDMLALGKGK